VRIQCPLIGFRKFVKISQRSNGLLKLVYFHGIVFLILTLAKKPWKKVNLCGLAVGLGDEKKVKVVFRERELFRREGEV